MGKVLKKFDIYIFFYGELANIANALFFSRVLNKAFCFMYIAMLLLLLFLKNILFRPQEKYADRTSLLGISLHLMEYSLLFLTYAEQSVIKETVIMLTACGMIWMVLKDHDLKHIRSNVLIALFLMALAVSVVLKKTTWTIELIKLLFLWSSLYLLNGRRVLWIFVPLAVCSAMLVVLAYEYGSIMVLAFTAVLMCILSRDKAAVITGVVLCAAVLGIWLVIYNSTTAYQWVIGLVGSERRVTLQRLFFNYKQDDQLVMINKMIVGRNDLSGVFSPGSGMSLNRRCLDIGRYILSMISPPEYTELVSAASSSTAAADYMYSLMCYVNPIYCFIMMVMFIISLFRSINRNINSELKIIPLILLGQTMIHILSNLMLVPFTGLPLPFLSHGPASLTLNVGMLYILSKCEIKNEEG